MGSVWDRKMGWVMGCGLPGWNLELDSLEDILDIWACICACGVHGKVVHAFGHFLRMIQNLKKMVYTLDLQI